MRIGPFRVRCAFLIALLLCAGSSAIRAQNRTIKIARSAAPECVSCRLEVVRLVAVGDASRPGTVHQQGLVARGNDGSVYVTSNGDPGSVRRFDKSGKFLHLVGRPGRGPGEFVGRVMLTFTRGDTILAIDPDGSSATYLDATFRVISSVRMPLVISQLVGLPDGRFVVTADDRSPARFGIPIHLVDRTGRVVRSFGTEDERVAFDNPYARFRLIGPALNVGSIWASRIDRYLLEQWDTLGTKVLTVERDAAWFRPWSEPSGKIGVTRQPSTVKGMYSRGDSLWVFVRVDDAAWKPMPPVPFPGMKNASYTPDSFREKLFDTMVEVFHIPSGRLILSERLPQNVVSIAPDGVIASYEEDSEGNPRYVLWQLGVRRR